MRSSAASAVVRTRSRPAQVGAPPASSRPPRASSKATTPISSAHRRRRTGLSPHGLASPLGLVALCLACSVAACGNVSELGAGRSQSGAAHATVDRVVDGDTVDLRFAASTERVRLLGIDTPETVKPNAPIECFGPEASTRTKVLLRHGTSVTVARDAEARDRYGRLLLYLYRSADGLFVNRALVAQGFARILSIAPNTAHAHELAAAADAARRAGRGLWSHCSATPRPP